MALVRQKCQHFISQLMGGKFISSPVVQSCWLVDSPDFLLRPFEISLSFLCSSHAFGKVRPCLGQTRSCLGLESEELAVFGIEFAGP